MSRDYLTSERKQKLNELFKSLRKNKLMARQNFLCCQLCAWAEMEDMYNNMSKDKRKKVIGYVFYHRQDTEDLNNNSMVHLRYDGANGKRQKTIGKLIVNCASELGIKTDWDGNPTKTIVVDLTNINKVPQKKG